MGVVVILMNQGLAFGLRATVLQAGVKERKGDLEVVDRSLRRLIALADPGQYPNPATLRGNAIALSLTTELPLPEDGKQQRVGATLLASGGQLHLHWSTLRHVDAFGGSPPLRDTVLLDRVERLELAYFPKDGAAWSSSWTGDKLPALIRIQVVFEAGTLRHWPPIIAAPVREALEE